MTPPMPPPAPAPEAHPRPRLAVSSRLLGEPVRCNGGHSRDRFLTGPLADHVDWVPVCPETETEIGLGVPRPTLRLLSDGRIVTGDRTADHTAAMTALAGDRIPGLAGIDGYVFKSRSPSCGLLNLPRHASGRPGEPCRARCGSPGRRRPVRFASAGPPAGADSAAIPWWVFEAGRPRRNGRGAGDVPIPTGVSTRMGGRWRRPS